MQANLKELLLNADEKGYAIPAFNYSDLWEMEAILEAAEECRSPVIIATNAQAAGVHRIPYLAIQAKAAASLASVPVVHHLDHCTDIAACRLAIDSGYDSVMIDYSAAPLEENIAAAAEVVRYAEKRDTAVEAEVGRIRGKNEEGVFDGEKYLSNTEDVLRFTEAVKTTSLAVGIGNAHGFYKGKPELNFERLDEINSAVDVPLVLHGGTGIPAEDIQKAIRHGINKVNIGTHLHHCYLTALEQTLQENRNRTNIFEIMLPVREAVKRDVMEHIAMCMSVGAADSL